jgi:hypothetical protein
LLTLDVVFTLNNQTLNFGHCFPRKSYVRMNLDKKRVGLLFGRFFPSNLDQKTGWATLWAIFFPPNPPVTLPSASAAVQGAKMFIAAE